MSTRLCPDHNEILIDGEECSLCKAELDALPATPAPESPAPAPPIYREKHAFDSGYSAGFCNGEARDGSGDSDQTKAWEEYQLSQPETLAHAAVGNGLTFCGLDVESVVISNRYDCPDCKRAIPPVDIGTGSETSPDAARLIRERISNLLWDAHKDIGQWLQLAHATRRDRPTNEPTCPTMHGIKESDSVRARLMAMISELMPNPEDAK